jgi:hypothetical protein
MGTAYIRLGETQFQASGCKEADHAIMFGASIR